MITLFLTCRKVSCCSSGSFGLKCWLLMFGVACMNFGPIRCFPLLCELLHSTIYMCDFKNRLKTVRWVFSKCSHKVLNAGVKLPSTLLPLRAKQHAPLRTYTTQQIKSGSVARAVYVSSLHLPAEQYNLLYHRRAFISPRCLVLLFLYYESWLLTQGANIVLLPTVIWHWVLLISCAPFLHPTFSLCLVRVGADVARRQNAKV